MKFRAGLVLILFFVVIVLITLSACNTNVQLHTPVIINIEGNLIRWFPVPDASYYIVSVQGIEYKIEETEFYINIDEDGQYSVKVKAVGDNNKFLDSEYSDIHYYTKTSEYSETLPMLSSPVNLRRDGDTLLWNSVVNAVSYRIRVIYPNGNEGFIESSVSSVSLISAYDGNYTMRVMAVANPNNNRNSQYSATISYTVTNGIIDLIPLGAPSNIRFTEGSLCWDTVANASGYIIYIDGVAETNVGKGINSYQLILTEPGDRVVNIKAKGDGSNYKDSDYSNALNFPLDSDMSPKGFVITQGALLWEEDERYHNYILSINGTEYEISDNTYTINLAESGDFIVKVKYKGDGIYYKDSLYSYELSYKVISGEITIPNMLITPTPLILNGSMLSFSSVNNALNYTIEISKGDETTYLSVEDNIINLNNILSDFFKGEYTIRIKAEGIGTASLYSEEIKYNNVLGIFGDEENPHVIYGAEDLYLINLFPEHYFVLGNDIDLFNIEFQPLCALIPFSGTLDGREYAIYNLAINNTENESGLFSKINGGKVINLSIMNAVIDSEANYVGALCGYAQNVVFDNILLDGIEVINTANNAYTGLLGGYITGTVNNIVSNGSIEAVSGGYVGGLSGYLEGQISNVTIGSENPMNLIITEGSEESGYIGGIAGRFIGLVSDLAIDITIEVYGNGIYVGGVAGSMEADIEEASLNCNIIVSANNVWAGGVAGIFLGNIVNIAGEIILDIEGINVYVGGLIGYSNEFIIEEVYIDTDIIISSDTAFIGGIIGFGQGNISEIEITSVFELNSTEALIGGIAGRHLGEISLCRVISDYSVDDVLELSLGGVVGDFIGNLSEITISVEMSIISSHIEIYNIGGAIGRLSGDINSLLGESINMNLLNTSEDEGAIYMGGISGMVVEGSISDIEISYSEYYIDCKTDVYFGGVSGDGGSVSLANVNINAEIISTGDIYAGGINARSGNTISDVSVNVILLLDGKDCYAGGVAGIGGEISDVYVNGEIIAYALDNLYLGGVAGMAYGDIDNLNVAIKSLEGDAGISFVGGIVGSSNSSIVISNTEVTIDEAIKSQAVEEAYLGGIAGYLQGRIENITVSALVLAEGNISYAGGIAGKLNNVEVTSVSVLSEISSIGISEAYAGGITGHSDTAAIRAVGYIGTIIAQGDKVYGGGIIGRGNANIYLCYVILEFNIAAANEVYIGGIGGELVNSNISESFSEFTFSSDINVTGSIGGLIGSADEVNVYNCYAVVDINIINSLPLNLGGLAGSFSGYISFSYVMGTIQYPSLESNIGSFIGINVTVVVNILHCYYDEAMTFSAVGYGSSAGVSAIIMGEDSTGEPYDNWDTEIWSFAAGSNPRLINIV